MEMGEVLNEVLKRVKPDEEERAFVKTLMDELREITEETAGELNLSVKPYFVGSLAKDTYLAGDHDVDLFLAFPLETPLRTLRERGLKLGRAIAEKLDSYEVAYAEHPYVRASYKGISVDLVPCYDVKSWRDVRTAVDRSILHTRWVNENVEGRNDEVRLLKRFLKGIQVYGSEVYVRGFSGYLAELLIIEYGSFLDVLERADILRKGVIDPANWLDEEPELARRTVIREREEDKPLVVIDPVDPRRNVAANLSWEKYGRFYYKSLEFLKRPSIDFFFLRQRHYGNYIDELRERGTTLVTLIVDVVDVVDDVLIPQLERSARGFERVLTREGFNVLGWNVGRTGGGRAFIMLELDRRERERVRLKLGPEFFTERGREFYMKNDKVWIVGRRLYSEKEVLGDVVEVIQELLERDQVALGRGIRENVRKANILVNYVPKELAEEAYAFLSREKWNLKG